VALPRTGAGRGAHPPGKPSLPKRIVVQALAFVAAAAVTDSPISPSRTVDEGWHALILHTRVYRWLCERVGRFLHRVPQHPGPSRFDPEWRDRSLDAIRAAGYMVDSGLWRDPRSKAHQVAALCQHRPPTCDDAPCEAPTATLPELMDSRASKARGRAAARTVRP
jgi:hypothetical protein